MNRRRFVGAVAAVGGAAVLRSPRAWGARVLHSPPLFRISLAQWSLHRALRTGVVEHLDLARVAAREFGIHAVEYVSTFFRERAGDGAYLAEMNRRAEGEGVEQVLIMVDGEGRLADPDEGERRTAVENHRAWLDAAAALGCHGIRVNAAGEGAAQEQARRAADSLVALAEHASQTRLNVMVENHGGLSSNGAWLAGVMRLANHPRVGTLPDFGNFQVAPGEQYDRYRGVEELMPFARGVSAKSHDFDEEGEETRTDYGRMLRIVLEAGYRGHIGVEYEGESLEEAEGIRATKRLLERWRERLEPEFAGEAPP